MLKDLVKKVAKTGLGMARFAAMEIKERSRYHAPSSTQPANKDAGQGGAIGENDSLPLVPEFSVVKLHKRLSDETPIQLVDCREEHEWVAGYIDGCIHIPMNELPERVAELSPEQPTVVYCLHGMRSAEVASWLKHEKGFADVRSLGGGIVSWYSQYDQERIVVVRSEDH